MFEVEQLREQFDLILQAKRQVAQRLDELAAEAKGDQRQRIAELSSHTQRHVELTERLLELVS